MSIRANLNERDQRFKNLRNAMEQKGLAAVIVAGHVLRKVPDEAGFLHMGRVQYDLPGLGLHLS